MYKWCFKGFDGKIAGNCYFSVCMGLERERLRREPVLFPKGVVGGGDTSLGGKLPNSLAGFLFVLLLLLFSLSHPRPGHPLPRERCNVGEVGRASIV